MLILFTLVVMVAVAVGQYRNGLFGALAMCLQVVFAGVITFSFWEPLADQLDLVMQNGKLTGYEDWVALTGLFTVSLAALRFVTNKIAPQMLDYHIGLQHTGAAFFGLLSGYLIAGFLICVMQTLPLEDTFLGFEPRSGPQESGLRSILPPDRVWLALMRYASAYPLHGRAENPEADDPVDRYTAFDRDATFEMRYLRYRRSNLQRGAMPYLGEFDREISRKK